MPRRPSRTRRSGRTPASIRVAIVSAGIGSLRGDSRGASTITQQLVRARLLDPELVQDPSRTAERKLKEIIQSIRVTQAFPGRGRQADDHHRLPQPELLRQPELRREGRRSVLLRDRAERARRVAGGDHRRAPEVAVELRPRPQRHRGMPDRRRRGRALPGRRSSSSPRTPPSSSVVTRSSGLLADGRTPMSGDQYTSADFTAAKSEEVILAPQTTPRWIAPHFVWAVRDELADQAVRDRHADLHRARARRPARHDDPRQRAPDDRREMGQGRRGRPAPGQPGGGRQGARFQEATSRG